MADKTIRIRVTTGQDYVLKMTWPDDTDPFWKLWMDDLIPPVGQTNMESLKVQAELRDKIVGFIVDVEEGVTDTKKKAWIKRPPAPVIHVLMTRFPPAITRSGSLEVLEDDVKNA